MMQPKTHIPVPDFDIAYCGRNHFDTTALDFAPPDEATCKTCQRCWALTQEVGDGHY